MPWEPKKMTPEERARLRAEFYALEARCPEPDISFLCGPPVKQPTMPRRCRVVLWVVTAISKSTRATYEYSSGPGYASVTTAYPNVRTVVGWLWASNAQKARRFAAKKWSGWLELEVKAWRCVDEGTRRLALQARR